MGKLTPSKYRGRMYPLGCISLPKAKRLVDLQKKSDAAVSSGRYAAFTMEQIPALEAD